MEPNTNVDNITIDLTKLSVVPLEQVRINTWNPKDKDTKEYQQIVASIKENGLEGFIIVRENEQDGIPYEILDGEQRFTACKEIGYTKILIYNAGVVDDRRAREKTLWHQVQAPFNDLSLAKLISKMVEDFGEIHTPFTEKKIAEMQELAKFSFDNYKNSSTKPPDIGKTELHQSFMVQLTADQHQVVQMALQKAKDKAKEEGVDNITDSRALELICAEYIAG